MSSETFPEATFDKTFDAKIAVMINVGSPAAMPTVMTQPRSAPSRFATAVGPGVGGTKACVTAMPTSMGRANRVTGCPVRLPAATASGRSITRATSRKTGMQTRNPTSPNASAACCGPNILTRRSASFSAPPDCSSIMPKIDPSPTTTATKPSVFPIPDVMDSMTVSGDMPAARPTPMEAVSSATNG